MITDLLEKEIPPARKNSLLTRGPEAERFWSNVDKTPTCWLWKRPCRSPKGPRYAYMGRDVKIGRLAFFFTRGHWPAGGAVRTCANHRLCVKPGHILDIPQKNVTEFLKVRGRHRVGRRPLLTACKRGHDMTGENAVRNGFQRYCRLCRNLVNRTRWARLRARGIDPKRVNP